ncbi:MAG: hypothetical protein JNK05_34710 [Myxococcales bacterium]|nr:hypothetical protein [Myxococcales bacterium]
MTIDAAMGTAKVRVRTALLPRDLGALMPNEAAFVLSPVGPPRLWGMVTNAASEAIHRAHENQPNNSTKPSRCAEFATRAVTHLRSRLIEPNLTIDAHLAFAVVAPRVVHLALSGGVRAYRVRSTNVERLQPRAEEVRPLGLSAPHFATESFERGDWLLLGTPEAFSLRAVSALQSLLGRGPDTSPSQLRDSMLAPAHETQQGGALVVLRSL